MNGARLVLALGFALHLAAATAWACPLCLGLTSLEPTLADEAREARDIVIADRTGKAGTYEIKAVVKGDAALNGSHVNAPDFQDTGPLILAAYAPWKSRFRALRSSSSVPDSPAPWMCLGGSDAQVEAFIRDVVALPATPPASDQEWNERLARFRPYVGHPDPRLARSALTEFARAPYRVLTAQQVDGRKLGAWLMSPAQADAQEMMRVARAAFGRTGDARPINDPVEAGLAAAGTFPPTP